MALAGGSVAGSVTPDNKGHRFSPRLSVSQGHKQESKDECMDKWSNKSMLLFLSP